MFADIIVDLSVEALDRSFQYIVPREMEDTIAVGMMAVIPFGRGNREMTGFVVGITEQAAWPVEKMKKILALKTYEIGIETQLMQLAEWIRRQYGGTMNDALKTVLPVKRQIKSVEEHWLNFVVDEEEVQRELKHCRIHHYKAKERFLQGMLEQKGTMTTKTARNIYNVPKSVIDGYKKRGFLEVSDKRIFRNPLSVQMTEQEQDIKILNEEQKAACERFTGEYNQGIRQTYLLYGVTGSGKTEVYIEMIKTVTAEGKQAIVLIPEIALTEQTVKRFVAALGTRVTVLHSRMSEGEKYDQYCRIKEGKADIVIGPRSALFVPFDNLGLIVIDEEHENSYKSESPPCYHAREVAIRRAQMAGASVVLGSATPSVESYEAAKNGTYTLLELKNRAKNARKPEVHVVDLREELQQGNRSVFSRILQEKIRQRLSQGEQTMLFLNRRGYAGFVSCRSCGYVIKCSHCDISMTAHKSHQGDVDKLVCHYCGHATYMPKQCPSCGSPYIAAFGLGTQKVEEMLQKIVPKARILRMDGDTTTGKNGHEQVLAPFRRGEADILIGTQMIVKGHDFPNVTLVAALAADLGMYGGDYRCQERTFDLLMQASGRAGRGEKPGEMIIQTYNPDQYCIEAVKKQDPEIFYNNEMAFRRMAGYPPYTSMFLLLVTAPDKRQAETCIRCLKELAQKKEILCVGPSEAGLSKAKDRYRYTLYLKSTEDAELEQVKEYLEQQIHTQPWALHCTVQFDRNPMSSY